MTGAEMMIAQMVKLLGVRPEAAQALVENINGRVDGALVHFDKRLQQIEAVLLLLAQKEGLLPAPQKLEQKDTDHGQAAE